ncbi:kinase-like protein [Penicillium riverlandense]|uniref:kinase-like protein n=1 Tax=Penicillium riverlandense TaxID=1903569 RepID=UPI002547BF60|nr:kinase-like protein [Penicillium riverlandense]KAJ5833424.1 kinase-like protein [Penicillium riverlandense]
MKIVQRSERFKFIDGVLSFSYVSYFIQKDGILYLGKSKDRFGPPDSLEQLEDVQQVQTEDRGPVVRTAWSTVYVKTPNLFAYTGGSDLEKRISYEVEACELLRQNPHPNIATYYGCQETNGRVSGLCFKQYTSTLQEKVNPGHLNKSMFRSSERQLVDSSVKASLNGILAGIQHIHSLGLVHNDISPANIMFDENCTAVIIDFGSCRPIGKSLPETGAGRTYEWFNPSVDTSLEKNDLDAFEELRTWLIGSSSDGFLFDQ